MEALNHIKADKPWNKGKLTGQKPPLKLREIWAIRIRLQIARHYHDLALFNLAIDSKLRSCDLVKIRVKDVTHGATVAQRAIGVQQRTGNPVQFEITAQTRDSILEWINRAELMRMTISSKAGTGILPIFQPGSMPGWSITGSAILALIQMNKERTRYAGRRHPSSIEEPRIFELCNCCWAIPKWRAQSDT